MQVPSDAGAQDVNADMDMDVGADARSDPAHVVLSRSAPDAAQHQLSAVLESITDAFFAVDSEWRFTYVNRKAEELFGCGREELLGQVLWEKFPQTLDSRFGREYRQAMGRQEKRQFEAYSPVLGRWSEVHAYPSSGALSVYIHDITERRRAEAALRETEHRYRSLIDNCMDAILLTAPDGSIAVANRASTSLLGYTESELRALGTKGLLDPSDQQLESALAERRRTGRFRGEIAMKRKGGARIQVELSSATFRDEQGAEWVSLFIRDIAERKAREAERERLLGELDSKQRWLQAVIEHVPVGVILVVPGEGVYVNHRTEELFGMKIERAAGSAQYAPRLLYPDGTPIPAEQMVSARVLRTGETIIGTEFLIERPNGERRPMLGSAAPIRSSDGKIVGAVGMFQDVSERMRAEERIRESERLLNGIFEILPVGLWVADQAGRIVRKNPAGNRLWDGTVHDEGPGPCAPRGWWIDGKPIAPSDWPLARALNKGETVIDELIRIKYPDDTQKIVLNSALPLCDESGALSGAVVVGQDITKLKEIEEQLRRALRLRDEVLSIVAHDLRNPLSAIGLRAQSLLRTISEEKQKKQLQAILFSAQQMSTLAQDLLDMARLDAGRLLLERTSTAIEPLLHRVLDVYQPLLGEARLSLSVHTAPGLPRVDADPERLAQVLSNLLGNAVKFTPAGGAVTVAVEPHDREICFSIADTGPGISRRQQEHLFDRFWQADRKDRRGAGLGLSICKGLVEAHGGHIWVQSEPGQGSTFRFTIPAAAK
ncbi:MAG: PAS domain S-box protein [Polyangia bacterium]